MLHSSFLSFILVLTHGVSAASAPSVCGGVYVGTERERLITEPTGRSTDVTYRDGDRVLAGKVYEQTELEYRFNMGGIPVEVQEPSWDGARKYLLTHAEQMAAWALNYIYAPTIVRGVTDKQKGPLASIAPLSEESVSWHGERHNSNVQPFPENQRTDDPFVTFVQGQWREVGSNGSRGMGHDAVDVHRFTYKIGRHSEVSIYYDTPNLDLLRRKRAVRAKEWRPTGSTEEGAKSVFVKRQREEERFPPKPTILDWFQRKYFPRSIYDTFSKHYPVVEFTVRDEAQLKLEKGISAQGERDALEALLRTQGLEGKDLQPIVRIENERVGLELVLFQPGGKSEKVGFITIDVFVGTDLRTGEKTDPISQVEIEILPGKVDVYRYHQKSFDALIRQFQNLFNGTRTAQPKYRQVLDETGP